MGTACDMIVDMRWPTSLAIAAVIGFVPATAEATWTIVAVDPETLEVGIAGASCVAGISASEPIAMTGLVPGIGVVAVQGLVYDAGRERAMRRLGEGRTPQDVVTELTSLAFDPDFEERQYGIVALGEAPAAFTGALTQEVKLASLGPAHSVQGHTLHNEAVISSAFNAYGSNMGCPTTLADRLLVALEAGAAQGGDSLCGTQQAALAAWLQVAGPEDAQDAPYLQFVIGSQAPGADNPVALLRAEYDQWRAMNPPDDSQCSGDSDGTGGATSDSTGDTADDSGAATTAGTDTDGSGGTASDTSGSSAQTGPGLGDGPGDTGCGCGLHRDSADPRPDSGSPAWLWMFVAAGLRRRRAGSRPGTGNESSVRRDRVAQDPRDRDPDPRSRHLPKRVAGHRPKRVLTERPLDRQSLVRTRPGVAHPQR